LGLAKKEEEIYLPFSKNPILLNKDSEALYVLQNIRDEAHRVAINENRRLRLKDLDINNLLSIKGVSEESINQLIIKYKTLENISSAPLNDLEKQLTKREAEKVFNYFSS
jgi:excinuclease ABC subunit C